MNQNECLEQYRLRCERATDDLLACIGAGEAQYKPRSRALQKAMLDYATALGTASEAAHPEVSEQYKGMALRTITGIGFLQVALAGYRKRNDFDKG